MTNHRANRVNEPTDIKKYHSVLRQLMAYVNGTAYPVGYEFTDAQLSPLKPHDIYRWMAYKVYGDENPGPDDKPVHGRSGALKYWKKSISYFMPNRLTPWDVLTEKGNPTRSKEINDLIKAVKKKETRRQGKKSKADRPMEREEYAQAVQILEGFDDFNRKYRYPTMTKFMFHLIARGDDTSHLKKRDVERSTQYSFTLTAKMRWSKNVSEERDCPKQILLGAMNPLYCVLLALAIFEEAWIGSGNGSISPWLLGEGVTTDASDEKDMDREANATKRALYNSLKGDVFDNPDFRKALVPEPLGTHSVKKYGTTHARRCGILRDFVDYRARWKVARVQERYADTVLPWPDIKTAAALCIGGICRYKLKEGCNLSDEWLLEHVAPNIRTCFGNETAVILAKPLLWACFDGAVSPLVPAAVRTRIITAYNALDENARLPVGENPVEKVLLVASESGGDVNFDEVPNDAAMAAGPRGGAGATAEWQNAVYAKITSVQRTVVDIQNTQASHHFAFNTRLRNLEANVGRIAVQPAVRRRGTGGGGGVQARAPATLGACPRDLHILWQEYEFGVGGRKPARQFTAAERGKVKFTYSRRKIVWGAVDRMIRSGNTAQVAIDKIYDVYGMLPVTQLINAMRNDERNGGHVQLR